ncbi:MAG: hypothetical protein K8R02_10100 [Anaerohalosphaeraceae bacterium]|nr:hypothetical protein [Anaerohalosphaeraceae bacterium]
MGAFFLYKSDSSVDVNEAKCLFHRKGFAAPKVVELGDWHLLQYKKILLNVENYIIENNCALFCCGTVIYHGLSYHDSLRRLLRDFQNNSINQSEVIGHFCLLFWDGSRLTVLTDQMNTFHIFVNDETTYFSSSFLAMLSASPKPLPLNRLAVCEKLSTGYIVSPDTLVKGISQVNDELADTFSYNREKIMFISHPKRPPIQLHCQGIEKSLSRQLEVLENHFYKLDNLHSEYSGELGLSDGYDSRLLLACSHFLSQPLSLHTHATKGVHDCSKQNVEQIASHIGQPLHSVVTHRLKEQSSERLAEILKDGLFFFDSRSSHNMGAFSETYTREYKVKALGNHRLSLNGLGGEVYRNYYETRQHGTFDLRQWMNYHIYYTFAKEAIGNDELFEEMHLRKQKKIALRLGVEYSSKIDFLWLRRYYSEVRMPDCDANNCDAQNQIAFYHMPFIQPDIIWEGINATRYIGLGGSYQGALIHKLSPILASFTSHYGYSFGNKLPWKESLRCRMKELLPLYVLNQRAKGILLKKKKSIIAENMLFINSNPILQEAKESLLESGVIKNLEEALLHYAQGPTLLYIGTFLREFRNKLIW